MLVGLALKVTRNLCYSAGRPGLDVPHNLYPRHLRVSVLIALSLVWQKVLVAFVLVYHTELVTLVLMYLRAGGSGIDVPQSWWLWPWCTPELEALTLVYLRVGGSGLIVPQSW